MLRCLSEYSLSLFIAKSKGALIMKYKIQKKIIIPLWLFIILFMMILEGYNMSQGYDQLLHIWDTASVKTKTKWGDIFTVVSGIEEGLDVAVLYDKNGNEITRTGSIESEITLLESSIDYPKGRWIKPILKNDEVRSYLFMQDTIVYYDKPTQSYQYYDILSESFPEYLRSSIEKAIEMNIMTDTKMEFYQENLDESLNGE